MNQFGQSENGRSDPVDPHALQTLKDDETIAKLATGIRRFALPAEFNPIKIYQTIADEPRTGHGEDALGQLLSIFDNRRQFDRAAGYLKRSMDVYGDPGGTKNQQMQQILGAWGSFETMMTQPAGRGATVDFRFRNGRRVRFEAHEVQFDKLLSDVKEYISSRPPQLDWQRIDVNDVGSRLVTLNQQQYLGRLVARWELELEPPAGHLDRRITVSTPLQKAGAYLLTARMDGGNESHIMVCLDDTVIVKKFMSENAYYFIADSRTGHPVPRADVDLFGWRMVQVEGKNQFQVETKTLSLRTDDLGQVLIATNNLVDSRGPYQWLCTARTPAGRLAHLGFAPIWGGRYDDPAYNQIKVYTITDRPVYRPGQPVRFKFWVARSAMINPTPRTSPTSPSRSRSRTRRARRSYQEFETDAFGGFDGSFELSSDAALGVYQVLVTNHGGGTFRVEEYKKPEFEVNIDAPTKPVMLGEKVSATIKAKYYFGGPVAEAKVKYKVTRTTADERWYPGARWDWLFGPGYWWFAADSAWYPGWSRWGIARPAPWWWGGITKPPEVVAQAEVPIRPDGTLPIEIDTAQAREAHPDQDQRYEITAEVTDQSRRTIVGTGTVLVAPSPSPSIPGSIAATTARVTRSMPPSGLRRSIASRSPARALSGCSRSATTPRGKPVETPVESWDLAPRRGRPGQPDHQSLCSRPVPALVHDRRRPWAFDRRRLPVRDFWARVRRGLGSGSTTSRSYRIARSIGPAIRSGC